MEKKVDLVLTAGGYKYPFYNGVMKFFEIHKDKLPLNSITGACSGAFCAAMHASGYSNDYRVRHVINAENILKIKIKKFFTRGPTYSFNEKIFESFVNIDAINSKPYKVYFGFYNTKTEKIVYKDLAKCVSNKEVISLIKAAHTLPGVTEATYGNRDEGYLVNPDTVAENMYSPAQLNTDTLKVVVLQGNPFAPQHYRRALDVKKLKFKSFLFKKLLTGHFEPNNNLIDKKFIEENPGYLYIYPDTPFSFTDSFVEENNYLEGYKKAKEILLPFIEGTL